MPQPMRFAFVHTACTHSKQRALNVQAILLSSTTERVLFLLRFNSATSFLARLAVGCVHFSRWACVLFFVFHYGNFCFLPINCTIRDGLDSRTWYIRVVSDHQNNIIF